MLAVDPGGTTGFACWTEGEAPWVSEAKPMEFLDFAEEWVSLRDVLIVCERFTIGPQSLRMSRQYDALEQIGALRWIAHRHGADFALQAPADVKRFVSNDLLKSLGWYTVGADHGRDATRHLVWRLVKEGRLSLDSYVSE